MTGEIFVDDFKFADSSITKQLSKDTEIEIIGFTRCGVGALEKVKPLKPDVITLDKEMLKMDELEVLEKKMYDTPTPVVMWSGYSDCRGYYEIS
ncbi:MAG: response regulator [Dehalococcoidales bacterium]|nr:MAG: response regulator [Dehalococcoidales bacterium]